MCGTEQKEHSQAQRLTNHVILLIDNYDSFVHNLARYFERLGQETVVIRNTAIDVDGIRQLDPDAIVLSPGPCTPTEAGISLDVVSQLHREFPLLGVCLGHQTIAAALGGSVVRGRPVHGSSSQVHHDGSGIFAGLPNPLAAARYPSLVVDEDSLPECLRVNARTADRVVMALEHRSLPVVGVQFHPESILTEHGYPLLAAFLRRAGIAAANPIPDRSAELAPRPVRSQPLPSAPVTF